MKTSQSPWHLIWRLVGADRNDLWTLVIYAGVVGLLTLAIPVAVQALVGTVAFGALLQPIFILTLLLLAGLALSATIRALEVWVIERLIQRLFVRGAMRIVAVLTQARSGARAPETRWELVNRFFDVVTAQKALTKLLSDGLAVSLQTAIGLIALSLYHPWLLGFGLLLALCLGGIILGLGRGGLDASLDESSAKYEVAAWLEQIAAQPATFRGAGAPLASQVAEQRTRYWVESRRSRFTIVFRQTVGTLTLQVLASVGLLALGGALVINQQLTLGQLVAAELIVTAVAAGIGKLGRSIDAAYDLTTAAAKLTYLEDALPSEDSGAAVPALAKDGSTIALFSLTLQADGQPLLQAANLAVGAGERIAIVGPSGSGKSALLDLLHGDWDGEAPGGVVEIDGVDLRSWNKSALRQRCALVRAHSIFAGTLSENLSIGRAGVNAIEQQRMLERLGLWPLLGQTQAGLQQPLRADGAPLPSGMLLPIAIGRALLGKPKLLLIDGLGELDPKQRGQILTVLLDRSMEMTVIIAAADPAWVAACDRVLRLENAHLDPRPEESD